MKFDFKKLLIFCLMLVCTLTVKVDAATLNAPELTVSNVTSSGKIKLDWNSVKGAEAYKVYRSTSKTGSYILLKTVTNSEHVNSNAVAGKRYYYYVRAVSKNGSLSAKSNVVNRYCKLKQPVIETITNVASSGKIKLTWNAIDKAASYKVYRSTSKTGTYSLIKSTEGTSFTNTSATAGKTYYYKIRAISSNTSANSAYSKLKYRACDLERPVVEIKLNSKGAPRLTWDAIDGAVKYEIYRSTNKSSGYCKMFSTTGVSYTNTNFDLDTQYYYKVKAICSAENGNSAFSVIDTIKTKANVPRYVLLDRIYAYVEPSSKSKSVAMPYMAEFGLGKIVYDYSSGKWYQIQYEGQTLYLWVAKGDKKFTDTESSYNYTSSNPYTQEILNLAKKIAFSWDTYYASNESTGIPDSNGKYGFDCSGYVTYCINTVMQKYNPAYRLIGDTGTLYKLGAVYNKGYKGEYSATDVSISNIQPGDLIFLDMSGTGMNHVAMYMGNGELAHISGTWNRVTIMPLEGSFEEKVVGVRRFIPQTVTAANKKMYANVGWCRLYEERSDQSKVLYTFKKNENLVLLYTNSGGNWAYVKTADNSKRGFVLTKFLSEGVTK